MSTLPDGASISTEVHNSPETELYQCSAAGPYFESLRRDWLLENPEWAIFAVPMTLGLSGLIFLLAERDALYLHVLQSRADTWR